MITDTKYLEFMQKLQADQRGRNSLNLSEWEANFLASFGQSARPLQWFTAGRRSAVDRMWRKLGPELSFPHPLDTVTERPKIPAADPTGCEYLLRETGQPQVRCNEPAVMREPGRLRYCQMHGDAVKKALPKTAMIPFQPQRHGGTEV